MYLLRLHQNRADVVITMAVKGVFLAGPMGVDLELGETTLISPSRPRSKTPVAVCRYFRWMRGLCDQQDHRLASKKGISWKTRNIPRRYFPASISRYMKPRLCSLLNQVDGG
jgi:hypothetical protein